MLKFLWQSVLLILFMPWGLSAQINSIHTLDVETWYDDHLAVNSSNELYLASELKEAQNDFKRGSYLVKLDSCNEVLWKRIYQRPDFSINVHDLAIAPNEDILMTGITDFKDIFLFRLNPQGEVLFAFRYQFSGQDFNYTLQVRNDRIMIFGNSFFGGGTPTRNFLLVLDENGNILWSKNYLPDLHAGEALFTQEGNFLCHSGQSFYLVAADGNLLWAKNYPFLDPDISQISNPQQDDAGNFYFTYYENDAHYLVKLDAQGIPQWINEGLPATAAPGTLVRLPAGLAWVNSKESDSGDLMPILAQWSFDGSLIGQWLLDLPQNWNVRLPEALYAEKDQTIAIMATAEDEIYRDLYVRTSLGENICYLTPLTETSPVTAVWLDEDISFPVDEASFQRILIPVIYSEEIDFSITEWCRQNDPNAPEVISVFLSCGESYDFTSPMPGLDHLWQDGSTANTRTFTNPGIYDLLISDCTVGYPYRLNIEKEPCDCQVDFPTAFSPNGDQLNDQFEPITDCPFLEYRLQVFDRFGQAVFLSDDPETGWDGTRNGQVLPSDTYVWQCLYRPDDGIGTGQRVTQSGEITLLR